MDGISSTTHGRDDKCMPECKRPSGKQEVDGRMMMMIIIIIIIIIQFIYLSA
jgi:hypothetical protein